MKYLKHVKPICLAVAMAFTGQSTVAQAQTQASVQKGRAIAAAVSQSDAGYRSEAVYAQLQITAANGSKAEREFEMKTLEKDPGGDKRVVIFKKPTDLAGFVSLNHSQLFESDSQWIYLPKLGRERRLSARDKTGSFAGSEFSYEDITRWELEKYDYNHLQTVPCGQARCEVLENLPRYPYSGYSKLVETVDMSILQPRKIVYFNQQGRAFKELALQDYQRFGRFWRPRTMVMTNLLTGAKSQINWGPYRYNEPLTDAHFEVTNIQSWNRN